MDAAGLPTVAPRPTIHPRPAKPFQERSAVSGDSTPKKFFARDKSQPFRPARPAGERFRPAADRPAGRPAWQKDGRSTRRPARFTEGPAGEGRPAAPRRQAPVRDKDFDAVRPPNLQIEEIQQPERSNFARPGAPRSSSARPSSGRPFRGEGGLPRAFTTSSGKPRAGGARPSSKSGSRPASGPRTGATRSGSGYRPSSGGKRPFDGPSTGSGSRPPRPYTPRPDGASGSRFPNTKKFAGSSSFHGTGPRSESTRREGPGGERKTGAGWKPKTRYGGPNKPASGVRSKPHPGSSAKSGAPTDRSSSVGWKSAYKGKPSGKRPGGAPGGKKRT
jgi:hypothetical protein